MTSDEKRELLASLEQGREALLVSLNGVNAEMAIQVPAPGKWSILDCVEHVAISEEYLFAQIGEAVPSETPLFYAQREALIIMRGPDRSKRVEAPEQARPCGRFAALPEALNIF